MIQNYSGPKSHKISLKNLTQIIQNSYYYPCLRSEAHRRRDVQNISLGVFFCDLKKIEFVCMLKSPSPKRNSIFSHF